MRDIQVGCEGTGLGANVQETRRSCGTGAVALRTVIGRRRSSRGLTLELHLATLAALVHQCKVLRSTGADGRLVLCPSIRSGGHSCLVRADLVITRYIHASAMCLALTVQTIAMAHSAFRRTGIIQEAAVHGKGFTEVDLGLDHAGLFHRAPLLPRSIVGCTQTAGGAEQR